jgi:hypothetical protein
VDLVSVSVVLACGGMGISGCSIFKVSDKTRSPVVQSPVASYEIRKGVIVPISPGWCPLDMIFSGKLDRTTASR